jgi:siroheme synthase-like protein
MPPPPRLYPLFLRLEGRLVVVAGAGAVAERKIDDLLAAGARVRVIAPEATSHVRTLVERGDVEWHARKLLPGDLDDAWLAMAATTDDAAQALAAREAERLRIFCIAVDDIPNTSAFGGATLRRPPFLVVISTSGEAPALARLLREMLDQFLPEESWIAEARALRRKWKADGTPMASRFGELVRAFKART